MVKRLSNPVNPNAQECVKRVMKYLADISGQKLITGQHTQEMEQEELKQIEKVTGQLPALVGFELLSYSPNINYLDTDEECMKEVTENRGTLQRAWEWAAQKGLITFTWHWFSPIGGRSKSFFTTNTDFDATRAIEPGTPENIALMSDMDYMAGLLRPFADAQIPILWRPFHECEGDWFWWGAKGPKIAAKLFRIMYERFTNVHHLNNLIWVWNSTVKDAYPGDDVVDIVTRDMYPAAHEHTARDKEYQGMIDIMDSDKIIAIGETGVLPDPEDMLKKDVDWCYYMTWSHVFCLTEEYNSFEYLKKLYDSELTITKKELPVLY